MTHEPQTPNNLPEQPAPAAPNTPNTNPGQSKDKIPDIALFLPIGVALGCSFGLLFDNLALGVALGLCASLLLAGGTSFFKKR